jgi:hypothetical protein
MTNKLQPYCQLETMSNLLNIIEGARPVFFEAYDPAYYDVGIKVDGMDYMIILFERNGLCGVTYDIEGYRGGRTWRKSKTPELNDDFVQRTEDEFCAAVVKEVNETRINCA